MRKPFPEEAVPLLGKYPDFEVAQMTGFKKGKVGYERRKRGIEACHPEKGQNSRKPKVDPGPIPPRAAETDPEKNPDLSAVSCPMERARLAYLELRRNAQQAEQRGAFTALASLRKVEREALSVWEAEQAKALDARDVASVEDWLKSAREFARTLPRDAVKETITIFEDALTPRLEVVDADEERAAG